MSGGDSERRPRAKKKRKWNGVSKSRAARHGANIEYSALDSINDGFVSCGFCGSQKKTFSAGNRVRWENMRRHAIVAHGKDARFVKFQRYLIDETKKTSDLLACFKRERTIEKLIRNAIEVFPVDADIIEATKMMGLKAVDEVASVSDMKVSVSDPKKFMMVRKFLEYGLSYTQIENTTRTFSDEFPRVSCSCSTSTVARYARKTGIISMTLLKRFLRRTMGFSLAFDVSTQKTVKRLGLRIRAFLDGRLQNVYVAHLSLRKERDSSISACITRQRAGDLMIFLRLICPDWSDKLVGLSTDGASDMFGVRNGFQVVLNESARNRLYEIWCGAHQLNVEVKSHLPDDDPFLTVLDSFVGDLRKRPELTGGKQCPNRFKVRWTTVSKVTNFVCDHAMTIESQRSSFAEFPSREWWVKCHVIARCTGLCAEAYSDLQGSRLLLSQQIMILQELSDKLHMMKTFTSRLYTQQRRRRIVTALATNFDVTYAKSAFGSRWDTAFVRGEVLDERDGKLKVRYEDGDAFWSSPSELGDDRIYNHDITNEEAEKFVRDTVFFYRRGTSDTLYESLKTSEKFNVIDSTIALCRGIAKGVRERCETTSLGANDLTREHPSVLPSEIVRPRVYAKIIADLDGGAWAGLFQRPEDAGRIKGELLRLVRMNETQPAEWEICIRHGSNQDGRIQTFREAWSGFPDNFTHLRSFCGALASVMPTTAQVEGDFSVMKHAQAGRPSLGVFDVQCALHAKQFDLLWALAGAAS